MTSGARWFAALLCASVVGCEAQLDPGAQIEVELVAGSTISDSVLASAAKVELTVRGAQQRQLTIRDRFTNRKMRVLWSPTAAAGTVELSALVFNHSNLPIAQGSASGSLTKTGAKLLVMLDGDVSRFDLAAPEDLPQQLEDLAAPVDLPVADQATTVNDQATAPADLAAVDLSAAADLVTTATDLAVAADLSVEPLDDLSAAPTDLANADLRSKDLATADFKAPTDLVTHLDFTTASNVDAGGDLRAPSTLVVLPTHSVSFVGGTQTLWANQPVTWSFGAFPPPGVFLSQEGVVSAFAPTPTVTIRATSKLPGGGSVDVTVEFRQPQVVGVAGRPGGPGNVDGVGPLAHFNAATHMTVVGSDIYVVDGHAIRRVSTSAGPGAINVATVLGSVEQRGHKDGIGTAARFSSPSGLTTDGTYLYVLEKDNCDLRRVTLGTFETTTIVGVPGDCYELLGVGTAAHLAEPAGLARDDQGNLYWSDGVTRAIYKLELATGTVTRLYQSNSLIRAGQLVWRGPAPGNLYLAASLRNNIVRISVQSPTGTVIAGSTSGTSGNTDATGTAARFWLPMGIALVDDDALNIHALYVGDENNGRIRRVDLADNKVSTPFGGSGGGEADGVGTSAQFRGLRGLFWSYPYLLVSDTLNYKLRYCALQTSVVGSIAGEARSTVSADGLGSQVRIVRSTKPVVYDNVAYFGDRECVRSIWLNTGNLTATFAGLCGTTGTDDGIGAGARFGWISGLVSDGFGTLYALDGWGCTVREINVMEQTVTTIAGDPARCYSADGVGTEGLMGGIRGGALDGKGNLYIVDDQSIRKLRLSTRELTTVAGAAGQRDFRDGVGDQARFFDPVDAVYSQGSLYVLDEGTVRQLDLTTREVTTLAGYPGLPEVRSGIGTAAWLGDAASISLGEPGELLIGTPRLILKLELATRGVSILLGDPSLFGTQFGTVPRALNAPRPVRIGPYQWLVGDNEEALVFGVQ